LSSCAPQPLLPHHFDEGRVAADQRDLGRHRRPAARKAMSTSRPSMTSKADEGFSSPYRAFIHSSFVRRSACCSTSIRRAPVVFPVPGRPTVRKSMGRAIRTSVQNGPIILVTLNRPASNRAPMTCPFRRQSAHRRLPGLPVSMPATRYLRWLPNGGSAELQDHRQPVTDRLTLHNQPVHHPEVVDKGQVQRPARRGQRA
jgi:hypothetical protein